AYGASLGTDTYLDVAGFEIVEMYCWISPEQFGLENQATPSGLETLADEDGNTYSLWRFLIGGSAQILLAERVDGEEIPHYFAHMTQDDMRGAQRSQMEMIRPFQRFISFLFNIMVAGA